MEEYRWRKLRFMAPPAMRVNRFEAAVLISSMGWLSSLTNLAQGPTSCLWAERNIWNDRGGNGWTNRPGLRNED
jgi:hypothetical protein